MAIVRGLCTLADARQSIVKKSSDTADDVDIEAYISAVTPLIEQVTGPMVLESRTLTFNGGEPVIRLPFAFNSVTSITVNGAAYTNFVAQPLAGVIYSGTQITRIPFYFGTQNVVVTVQVGFATIPPNVVLAAREAFRELWQIGRQGTRPSTGVDMVDAAVASQGYVMSRRVLALLAPNPTVGGFA